MSFLPTIRTEEKAERDREAKTLFTTRTAQLEVRCLCGKGTRTPREKNLKQAKRKNSFENVDSISSRARGSDVPWFATRTRRGHVVHRQRSQSFDQECFAKIETQKPILANVMHVPSRVERYDACPYTWRKVIFSAVTEPLVSAHSVRNYKCRDPSALVVCSPSARGAKAW